jgi:MFS family permease
MCVRAKLGITYYSSSDTSGRELEPGEIMSDTKTDAISIWKRQRKNWRLLSLRSIFNRFLQNLTVGYISIYINQLGASSLQLGYISSIATIGETLISAPLGWLQDKYSLRKIFLLGTIVPLVVSFLFASATNLTYIIPAMILSSVSFHAASCLTICDVSVRNEDRSTCKGICDGAFGIPSLFAPAVAAVIIGYFGGISVRGIRPLFWIQLLGGVLLYLLVLFSLKEIERPPIRSSYGVLGDYRDVFRSGRNIKKWILFSLVGSFSFHMMLPFTQLYAFQVKGADQYVVGLMTSAGMVVVALLSPLLGRVADRFGRKRMFYMLEPVYILSVLLLILAPSPAWLILASALGGFKMIAEFISLDPLQVELVPVEHRGRWRGILGLLGGLIAIPAPVIGALIWDRLSPSHLLLVPVVLDLLLRIPLLMTVPERRSDQTSVI